MTISTERRRPTYRRYSDRRVALMLELYEILFEDPTPEVRDTLLLDAIRFDFGTDAALLVDVSEKDTGPLTVRSISEDADFAAPGSALLGDGIRDLRAAHEHAQGAITLTRFRRPSMFEESSWENLWKEDLGAPATALLSVSVSPSLAKPSYLWLLLQGASKEWSSHDRELAEEISHLMARVADKAVSA